MEKNCYLCPKLLEPASKRPSALCSALLVDVKWLPLQSPITFQAPLTYRASYVFILFLTCLATGSSAIVTATARAVAVVLERR